MYKKSHSKYLKFLLFNLHFDLQRLLCQVSTMAKNRTATRMYE